jgi:ring-1,2-phenylacetyl-CoA epoxidase subunit PaaD
MAAAVDAGTTMVSGPGVEPAGPEPDAAAIRTLLSRVVDPEIPVLTIEDMGILRSVEVAGGAVTVTITPTYSGCPAMTLIAEEITRALAEAGLPAAVVRTVYAPAWTTDWMSEAGREKLAAYGIAPPQPAHLPRAAVHCPRCRGGDARTVSEFGSTACKALMVCTSCGEPFDYFKEI